MKKLHFSSLLSYTVAAVTLLFGIGIIVGFFKFENVPPHLRVMFSTVLILWSVYRVLITYTRDKQHEREEE